MKKDSKTQLSQILADKAPTVMPINCWQSLELFATVDYITGGEKSLPRIRFSWVPSSSIYIRTEEELQAVRRKFPDITIGGEEGTFPRYLDTVLVDETGNPERQIVYVCNFRRYGWCSSRELEKGYSGLIYANGVDAGITAATPEQIVRETMISCLVALRVPDELKYHRSVRPLWERLLADALENISHYATHAVGCICINGSETNIMVNGERVGWRVDRSRSMEDEK